MHIARSLGWFRCGGSGGSDTRKRITITRKFFYAENQNLLVSEENKEKGNQRS